MGIEEEVEELRHRVEALEQLVRAILSRIPEVRIECSVPKIVYERRYEYVKVSEDELYGRIVRLALEHLVALEVLERSRQPGRRARWLFKKTDKLGERVTIVEGNRGTT